MRAWPLELGFIQTLGSPLTNSYVTLTSSASLDLMFFICKTGVIRIVPVPNVVKFERLNPT